MANRRDMQAFVTRLYRRKQKRPIPPRRQPGAVGIGHALGQSGGAAGMANNKIIVRRDRYIRVIVGKPGQPVFIAVIPADDFLQLRQCLQ